MNKINKAIKVIHTMDYMASRDQWLNRIHPLVKLCLTIVYIELVVSIGKYDILGALSMFVYPMLLFSMGDVDFGEAIKRLKVVLPLVCIMGVFNPFFDVEPIRLYGDMTVRAGVVSMIVLMIKGVFTVLATYLLIASTTMDKICGALRQIHVPKPFVTELMLIYRYITLLLTEADRITQAYALRAPGQKGVAFRVWGSLIGQLLLRSVDRADGVYGAMQLRGYNGEFPLTENENVGAKDIAFLLIWIVVLCVFRFLPVFEIAGKLVV